MAALLKKKKSREAEIPMASMADIAFLLLIFFLVTTTIDVDTGIGMVLPPPLDQEQDPPPVKERNMLKILISDQGAVLLEDKPSAINLVRGEVIKHITNDGADPNYAESARKAVVSIKTARQTPYESYVGVLDEVWMGYFEVWDGEARKLGFPNYKDYVAELGDSKDNEVRDKIPAAISIAEPDPS
ncbi:MAG: biopolymer transporter ExbD [Rhodothermia bacterium]|nr:biopolymer transporter ExbD [Rhodothermia bacterium]